MSRRVGPQKRHFTLFWPIECSTLNLYYFIVIKIQKYPAICYISWYISRKHDSKKMTSITQSTVYPELCQLSIWAKESVKLAPCPSVQLVYQFPQLINHWWNWKINGWLQKECKKETMQNSVNLTPSLTPDSRTGTQTQSVLRGLTESMPLSHWVL